MRRLLVVGVLAALTLAGCGQASIPRAASRELGDGVAAIRSAVEDGRVGLAERRLDGLATLVRRLLDRGRIDDATAIDILESAEAVRDVLHLAPEPSPTTVEPTTPPPPPEDEGDEGGGKGKGKDKDDGKGHGDEGHGNDD